MCGVAGPRVYIELGLAASDDGDLRSGFGVGSDPLIRDEIGAKVTTSGGGSFKILPNSTDVPLSFGGTTRANVVYLLTNKNITYRLNGGPSLDLKIVPADTTGNPSSAAAKYDQQGIVLMAGTNVTSITVSNPSSTDTAIVQLLVRGEG